MGLRSTYRRSGYNKHGKYGKSRRGHRVRFKIPPTIYEAEEEAAYDENGDLLPVKNGDGSFLEAGDTVDAKGSNAAVGAKYKCQVVDLSILDTLDTAANKQYRKSKKIHNIDWDDSNSDSSANTHDSLRVHTCAQPKKDSSAYASSHHHGDKRGKSGKSGKMKGTPFGTYGTKNHLKFSKVQTIYKIIERIGSGSSFNSSEGPSDSSKHNMKVWENAYRGNESKHKRSLGLTLKKLFSFSSKQSKNAKQATQSKRKLDRRVLDIRKLSL